MDTSKPFTRAQALSSGISRRALTNGNFRRIVWGVYVDAAVPPTPMIEAAAALLVSPTGSHASHFTAARIWGGVVPDQPLIHVCAAPGSTRCQRQGIRSHECADLHHAVTSERTPVGAVIIDSGVRVSTPARSFLELASAMGLVDLVVLGDSLVKSKRVVPHDLVEAADDWHGPGAVRARRAARFVRAGVDSPMETRLRMLMVLAGLPEPTVNHVIRWPDGSWRFRFDLAFPDHRLAIEYDGRHHVQDDATWESDIYRREDLDRGKWRRVTVISSGIFVSPDQTLRRIVDVMREVGVPGVPRRLSDEWRAHFPGRPVSYLSDRT
ncbi:hypothetical protein [Segeticoccus rhizosphaerae]|uniref:hypothetical protein n=1 Tax=Segeticoccus rhizosphaerae TaxID=1104777 RepID=UPI001EE44879|nr:hypothetical protein [Ornithinicoccus soli]